MKREGSISWWITGIIFFIGVFFGGSPIFPMDELPQQFTITVSDREVKPGQEIFITYTASSDWSADAWIGFIPADIPLGNQKIADEYDLDYRQLKNTSQGKFSFIVPNVEGIFNFRLYPSDDDSYPEVAVSESIKVVKSNAPLDSPDDKLKLENPDNELPSFPEEDGNEIPFYQLLGMGQIATHIPSLTPTPIPTLTDISSFPINLEKKDELPSLSSTESSLPELSLPPTDTNPPQVVFTRPHTGAVEVSVDTQIEIQFDEPIQPGPRFQTITFSDQDQNATQYEVEVRDNSLLIKPRLNLEKKTTYQIILPYQSIMDKQGNSIPDNLIYTFTTVEPPPMTTISLPFIGGKPQEIIKIPVYFNGSQKTVHIEMFLNFDPNLLEFLKIATGEINEEWLTQAEIADNGRIRLSITQGGDQKLTKDRGSIATLEFRVVDRDKTSSQSELLLEELKLLDQNQNILPGTVFNGMFHLIGSESETVSSSGESLTPIPTSTPFQVELVDMIVEPSSLLNGKIGEEYLFKASLENTTASIKNIKFQWNFGDGSKIVDSSEGEMTHIFSQPGYYEITVKAFNRNNGQMIAMKKLKVEIIPDPPVIPTINTNESQAKTLTHQEKYPNGKMKIQYTYFVRPDGTQVKNGLETSWYENGKKKSEGEYQNGKKVGVWVSWYDNGVIGQKGAYQDDQKNGVWMKNYRNGNKESEGFYKNNLREGSWKKWYENGKLWAEFECKNDQIVPESYVEYRP
ncbi:MAG: PKD domain-containing protein [Candidatus Atribacteria bacterium]|nr:PKD domain-containing protein [Candidatus Atribacteria bacterium]